MDAIERAAEAQDRAEQYRRLAESPCLLEAFEAIRQQALDTWRETKPEDTAAREDAYQTIRAVDRVERWISVRSQDGAVTAHNARAALRNLSRAK